MANQFNSYMVNVPKKNRFKALSHTAKLTCDMGYAVPVLVQDVIPNDTFKISVQSLIRFAPLLAPMMSEVDVYFHAFFVPDRIIWTKAEDFYTGAHNGVQLAPEDVPQRPRMYFTGDAARLVGRFMQTGSLADYLGFQTIQNENWGDGDDDAVDLDEMPFRAYLRIWYDYYRDENLSYDNGITGSPFGDDLESIWESSGYTNYTNGSFNNTAAGYLLELRRRAWKKDYFTSALPFPQKGDDVLIPSNISSVNNIGISRIGSDLKQFITTGGGSSTSGDPIVSGDSLASGGYLRLKVGNASGPNILINPDNLVVTPSAIQDHLVNESTIRDLRRAFAAQKFLERRAVGGSRYQEQNLAFFGIRGSDARLQRSEYLGGIKNPVVVSQILQTSETTEGNPLGTPAGNAVSASSGFLFNRTFEEYGWIMIIMSVTPKADYIQGTPRMYLRKDVYDYYWPQFARVGEQPILNQEVFTTYSVDAYDEENGINNGTFGYTPRYAEYRFRNNRIHGDFRTTLSFWTQARNFDSLPSLNGDFVSCNPSNRVFAVDPEGKQGIHHLWCECYFNIDAIRPVTKYAESL